MTGERRTYRLAAVIGDPVGHSRSPMLHGHWLARYAISGAYVPLHVRAPDLAETLRLLPRIGFVGVNVTLPHKEAALALASRATPRARRIGAANTLTFAADGSIDADNTDAEGFLSSLRSACPGWRPGEAPASVLGAGGAARAIVDALLEAGVPELRLLNRSPARAEEVAQHYGPRVRPLPWSAAPESLSQAGLLVNATSLGMAGQPPLDIALDGLPTASPVCDIVYVPLETPLLAAARARGNPVVDGLGMLLHQAVPGFERWFGRRPEVDEALRAAVLAP
ncbi:MAG: shikimate dehydrogenase [Alphaproteobacteria bacterium HGW-Alphaproteobacteria-2]|nr:MAG: shikimate dehydrogenase [Alphaproteobacteria bacterium HGW-Alphaproteobacteria-2]